LIKLSIGAEIRLFWKQQAYVYKVMAICNMPVGGAKFEPVLERTQAERLTITTAGGAFNNGSYSHLLIVIAERNPSTGTECPAGTSQGVPPRPTPTPLPGS
jgi:hypothetical protein